MYFVRFNKHTILRMNIEIKDNNIQVYIVKQLEYCKEMLAEDVSVLVTSRKPINYSK